MTYFIDANIMSYMLRGSEAIQRKMLSLLLQGHKISIPVVAYYEVKRGLLAKSALKKLKLFNHFAESLGITDMTRNSFDIASEIYSYLKKLGQLIEDDDIFIGSIVLENEGILATNNIRHLGRIPNLQCEIWE